MRQLITTLAAGAGLLALSCGGSSPAAPSGSSPTSPSNSWSVAGTIVETVGGASVPGAQIMPGWDLATATSGQDGSFRLGAAGAPPISPLKLSLVADGFVRRDAWVTLSAGARGGVSIDIIRNAPPFSMDFYRQFVRGTYDQDGAPYAVMRWTDAPKFYVRTVDQNGKAIEPEVVTVVRDGIARAVPAFTAGKFGVAALESGTDQRAQANGWINVDIRRDPNERERCGWSYIGSNPGTITLMDDVCSCGSTKITGATVMHEVGHALGFFHVSDSNSLMYPYADSCSAGGLSAAERYHVGIAYSRQRGNTDPDSDPSSSRFLRAMPSILVVDVKR